MIANIPKTDLTNVLDPRRKAALAAAAMVGGLSIAGTLGYVWTHESASVVQADHNTTGQNQRAPSVNQKFEHPRKLSHPQDALFE